MAGPELRLPTWEQFLINYGSATASWGARLTSDQKKLAKEIFGDSIDLTRVRVRTGALPGMGGAAAMVLGNTVIVDPKYALKGGLLAHELTHVWQYQTTGSKYLSNATVHRSYRVKIVRGRPIGEYNAEQQATIVENYYYWRYLKTVSSDFRADNPNIRGTMKEVDRLMNEIRGRRPQAESTLQLDLNRAMTGADSSSLPSPADLSDSPNPVYQLELRF